MAAARVLSWTELGVASLLALFGMWILLDLRFVPTGAGPHGYAALGAIACLCLAFALGIGGVLLRRSSVWRWLGQLPLIALLIVMYVLN